VTVADAKAALERGRPLVLVRPPAAERAADLWDLVASPEAGVGPRVLIICADDASAGEWAAAAPPGRRVHAVTGLTRATRAFQDGPVDVVAGAVADLAALLERAALKLDRVATVVVAWPEALVAHAAAAALDTLLAEARNARRIVLSWNPAALRDFLERHAPRALVEGAPPQDESGRPLAAAGPARYAVIASSGRAAAVRDATDALSASHPFVWAGGATEPPLPTPDAVLCTTVPTRDEFAALARLAEPILLVTAAQLPYVRSLAAPLTVLRLSPAPERARDRATALHQQVGERIAAGDLDAELLLLEPLFERFDPAEVAAALLAIGRERARGSGERPVPEPTGAARVRLFVNVGKKDRAAAKDLVGALIREAGVAKGDIGRIEVRETFSLVEVTPGAAEQAARGLTGVTIRGRRVLARLDREA
jgi:DbpA-like RNA binding protein